MMALIKVLILVLQRLPPSIIRGLGRSLGCCLWWIDLKHRSLVCQHLNVTLFSNKGDRRELKRLGKKSMLKIFENLLMSVWVGGQSERRLKNMIQLQGVTENLLPVAQRRRGVVVVMHHYGNWEACCRIAARIPDVKFSAVFQPLKNRSANKMISQWRKRSGVHLINRHNGFGEAVKRLRRGEAVVILVDQHAGDHGMWIPFFNKMASTTTLPSLLARKTGAGIVPLICQEYRQGEFYWRVEFEKEIPSENKTDGEIMFSIHRHLEEWIRREPTEYFWLHQRWKVPSPQILFDRYRRGFYVPTGMALQPFRLLIRSTNWLGDAVMTLPALHAIKRGRPDMHVTLLCPTKLSDLWREQSCVDEVLTSWKQGLGQHYDAALLFPNSIRSALEAWRLGIKRRLGYAGHFRQKLLTAVCPEWRRSKKGHHEVLDFLGLAEWLNAKIHESGEAVPRWEFDSEHARETILHHLPSSFLEEGYWVIHPGAAHGSAKRWLAERFVEVVRRFPNINWVVIGNKDEGIRNQSLVYQMNMGIQVFDLTGKLLLHELGEILGRSKGVVCNDSGPMHLASAAGSRVIAIFGSTEPSHTGPLGEGHQILRHPQKCSPCYLKECPLNLECMKAVTIEEVVKAIQRTETGLKSH